MGKLGRDCKPGGGTPCLGGPLPRRLALAQAPHEFFMLLCGSQAKYPDFPFLCSRFPTQLRYHGYIHRHCPATSTSPAYRTFCNPVPKAVVAAGQTSASGCPVVTMSPLLHKSSKDTPPSPQEHAVTAVSLSRGRVITRTCPVSSAPSHPVLKIYLQCTYLLDASRGLSS